MAKEKPNSPSSEKSAASEASNRDAAKPKSGKRGLLIMLLAGVLLASGGGGGWFYLRGGNANAKTAEPDHKPVAPPIFVNLEAFTVNLADREHFLQLGVAYEVAGNTIIDAMKVHMTILRSRVLLLLSSKSSDDLGSPDGKTKLAEQLVALARETIPVAEPEKSIAAVHFSAFVIQ